MNSSSGNSIFKCKSCALYLEISILLRDFGRRILGGTGDSFTRNKQWNCDMLKFLQEIFLNKSVRVYMIFSFFDNLLLFYITTLQRNEIQDLNKLRKL